MVFWWPEQGLAHSRAMLKAEIGYLDEDFRRSIVTASPVEFVTTLADRTYYWLFEWTGLVGFLNWMSSTPTANEDGLRSRLYGLYQPVAEFVIAAMQIIQVFSVRIGILVLASPVFVLFGLVALVDGLVRRDLRRWGGGRESSFVYHWAKRSAMPSLLVSWVIYLALPISVHPTYIVLPFASLFGLCITVTAATFKKYV